MLEFRKKKKIRKLIYSPFVLFFLLVILALVTKGVWSVYQKEKISSQKLEQQRQELDRLVLREKNLSSSIDYLKTDQGVENEIRTKFRAVKENEMVAVIIDEQTSSSTSGAATTSKKSFWQRIFGR